MYVYGVLHTNPDNGFNGIKIVSKAFNLKYIDTEIKLVINIAETESLRGSSNIINSKWLG